MTQPTIPANGTHAVVFNEHTLGILYADNALQILHASILRGAVTYGILNGTIHVTEQSIRRATLQDFDDYRVSYHPSYLLS